MYRFKSGQFEGEIVQQVMLRNAPDLYRLADWAERKAILHDMRDDFDEMRERLTRAPSRALRSSSLRKDREMVDVA